MGLINRYYIYKITSVRFTLNEYYITIYHLYYTEFTWKFDLYLYDDKYNRIFLNKLLGVQSVIIE